MVRIDSYRFGEIIADGKTYTEKPEVLVIGTGNEGRVEVLPETKRYLEEQGIELIAQVTGEACQIYNRLHSSNKAVAALHITC
jgi:hypothetical protein